MDIGSTLDTGIDDFEECSVFPPELTGADAEPQSDDPGDELAEFQPESLVLARLENSVLFVIGSV